MAHIQQENFIDDLHQAVAALRRGGVILYPTDTVWGIGCDARCAEAVARVYAIKRRSEAKSLIMLVDSEEMLARHVGHVPTEIGDIVDAEAPRPVTVILPDAHGIAPATIAADGSAGFRISHEKYSSALCRELGAPVVSTSANISGHAPASVFAEIEPEIVAAVDYAALYRRDDNTPSRPSKIIKLCVDGTISVIRS